MGNNNITVRIPDTFGMGNYDIILYFNTDNKYNTIQNTLLYITKIKLTSHYSSLFLNHSYNKIILKHHYVPII